MKIIILNITKIKDNSLIVNGYSEEEGRCSFIFNVGKKRSASIISILHPLSLVEVTLSKSRFSALETAKEIESILQLKSIRSSVLKSSLSIFIGEVISKCIKEIETNAKMFNYLINLVKRVENAEENIANLHLDFIVEFTSLLGFTPNNNYSSENRYFNIDTAQFRPYYDDSKLSFNLIESEILYTILKRENTVILNLCGDKRYEFVKKMILFIEHHLGFKLNIKSLDVLHEIFQ